MLTFSKVSRRERIIFNPGSPTAGTGHARIAPRSWNPSRVQRCVGGAWSPRRSVKPETGGSNPPRTAIHAGHVPRVGQQTVNLRRPVLTEGSIPSSGTIRALSQGQGIGPWAVVRSLEGRPCTWAHQFLRRLGQGPATCFGNRPTQVRILRLRPPPPATIVQRKDGSLPSCKRRFEPGWSLHRSRRAGCSAGPHKPRVPRSTRGPATHGPCMQARGVRRTHGPPILEE